MLFVGAPVSTFAVLLTAEVVGLPTLSAAVSR